MWTDFPGECIAVSVEGSGYVCVYMFNLHVRIMLCCKLCCSRCTVTSSGILYLLLPCLVAALYSGILYFFTHEQYFRPKI